MVEVAGMALEIGTCGRVCHAVTSYHWVRAACISWIWVEWWNSIKIRKASQ